MIVKHYCFINSHPEPLNLNIHFKDRVFVALTPKKKEFLKARSIGENEVLTSLHTSTKVTLVVYGSTWKFILLNAPTMPVVGIRVSQKWETSTNSPLKPIILYMNRFKQTIIMGIAPGSKLRLLTDILRYFELIVGCT